MRVMMQSYPWFVNLLHFRRSASIKPDNNNEVLIDFMQFSWFILEHMSESAGLVVFPLLLES